jgi:isoquinoline 1-oxidoreductase beta subunit
VRGVRRVVKLPDAVAVVADSTWAALKGAKALKPVWTATPGLSSEQIETALAAHLDAPDAVVSPRDGGAAIRERLRAAYAAADRKHEATYQIAYLAHATMEPMNATAQADATHAEVWAPCQSPSWLRRDIAKATGLKAENITAHPLLMGGGFGRRGRNDYGIRAVQIAQIVGGAVQVVWTREEDFTQDVYRPAMHMTFRAPLNADGTMASYEVLAATADDLTGGTETKPYSRLPTRAATLSNVKLGVPIGAWRAVDPGMAMFARESFVDECAHLAGANPLAYRDAMLGDNERARRVLQAAAKAIGWSSPRPAGVGRGLALLDSWDTLVAHAVEVRVEGKRLIVTRLVAAVDPGLVVNPQQVRAQFEGGGLMALSAALQEEITIKDGAAVQRNFTDYAVLRMPQAPKVDVLLFETPGVTLGGAGEPPVPGVAPALANAIFQATGQRIRRLPIRSAGFEV